MTSNDQGIGVLSQLAKVRAAGRVWARRQRGATEALNLLWANVREASDAGASVTEIAEHSGLSRGAVYRALHRPQRQ